MTGSFGRIPGQLLLPCLGMPYVIDYRTASSAGQFRVEGVDVCHALAKAAEALKGLHCISAMLLCSRDPIPTADTGSILATYTPARGWRRHRV